MASATIIPVEEYLRLTDKPNREYRNGALFPKPMPTKLHSLFQYIVLALLREQGAPAYPELTLKMAENLCLVPDVCIAPSFAGRYPTEAIPMCCEILSPDDRLGATLAKCEEYHAWGVRDCWVIDPEKRSAWSYRAGQEPIHLAADGVLQSGDFTIPLQRLFAAVDREL